MVENANLIVPNLPHTDLCHIPQPFEIKDKSNCNKSYNLY